MAPPSYSDLGKSARDLFNKGFNYGFAKLECKTKTENGVKLTSSGSGNLDTSKVTADLETEYEFSDYGVTFKEKWNTENVLNTAITIEDQLAKGLKLSFDTSFAPQTGKKSGKIKTAYKMDYVNLNCDVDFDFAGPTVHGAAVLGYNGYLAGYQMSFDTSKSKLTKSNFALGYTAGDFTINTNVNDATEFGGSIYQKVSDNLETGVQLSWQSGTNDTQFALGSKYTLDRDASINAKVNNQGQLGFGYTQKLRDGMKLTLSSLIEGKSINAGGHKLGLGLELEA